MIRQSNVRARCFQPNLQARSAKNRKYWEREYKIYSKQCKRCHRPASGRMHWNMPGLCISCGLYLESLDKYLCRTCGVEKRLENSDQCKRCLDLFGP